MNQTIFRNSKCAVRNAKVNQRGFTMVEVMVVCALLALLLMSFYTVLELAYVLFRTDNVYAELNHDAMQTVRFVSREVGQTSPVASPSHLNIATDGNNNSVLRFQVPVDWDGDGDVIQNNTTDVTEWGAYTDVGTVQNGQLGAWVRYSVVNNQLIREMLDAGLNAIANTSRVVSNNVQTFTAAQNQETLQLNLTLQKIDGIGQQGASRTIQSAFSSQTLLRNAVD